MLIPGIGTALVEEIGRRDLPADVQQWPPDWREAYEERVAIMEYDGGLPPNDAAAKAEMCCRKLFQEMQ